MGIDRPSAAIMLLADRSFERVDDVDGAARGTPGRPASPRFLDGTALAAGRAIAILLVAHDAALGRSELCCLTRQQPRVHLGHMSIAAHRAMRTHLPELTEAGDGRSRNHGDLNRSVGSRRRRLELSDQPGKKRHVSTWNVAV